MKRIILIILFFPLLISAQRVQNFNLVLTQTIVSVRFSISAGAQCNGYNILHSIDSLNFYPIYSYGGVCGDITKAQDYGFDHYTPTFDAVNFYKIELPGVETSPARRIYVPASAKVNMLVWPNPIYNFSDQLQLRIFNTNNTKMYGFLISQSGKPRRELIFTTSGDWAALNVYDLDDGLYVIWLTDGYQLYSSKFIIQR